MAKFPLTVWFTAPVFTTGTCNCPKLSKLILNTPPVAFCTLPVPIHVPAPQLIVPLLVRVLLSVLLLPVVRVAVAPAATVKPPGPAIVPLFHVRVPPGAMVVPLPVVVFQIAPTSRSRILVVLVNGVFCVTVLLTLKVPAPVNAEPALRLPAEVTNSVRPVGMFSVPALDHAAAKVHVPAFTLTLPPLLLVKVAEVAKLPLLVWFTAPLFTTGTCNCPKLSKLMLNTPPAAFCTLPVPIHVPAPQLIVPLLVRVLLRVLLLPVVRVIVAAASTVKPPGPAIVPLFHVSVPPGAMVVPLPNVVFHVPKSTTKAMLLLVHGVFCVTVPLAMVKLPPPPMVPAFQLSAPPFKRNAPVVLIEPPLRFKDPFTSRSMPAPSGTVRVPLERVSVPPLETIS